MTIATIPTGPEAPIDPAVLARMASALFAALPGTPPSSVPALGSAGVPPGVQAPVNIAPPGSPLVSPAGFGPSVPGTPVPQGVLPGANLLPASPTPLASLAHRAPALLPHAPAGNGLPDNVVTALPAYEPRLGGAALGVPEASGATAHQAATHPATGAVPYYFLDSSHGHPSAGGTDTGRADPLDALAGLPFTGHTVPPSLGSAPASAAATPSTTPSADPKFYFVDAVVLPSGYVTPAKAHPHGDVPKATEGQRQPFDVNAVRRDFPILQERVNGRQLVWFDNAATTHKPQSVIDRAKVVLEALESGEREGGSRQKTLIDDLPLFRIASQTQAKPAAKQSSVEARLKAVLPDELTPIEALRLVYELQALLPK